MMAGAFLDHHRDSAAELLIDRLDGRRVFPEKRIDAAAHMKQRHVIAGQVASFDIASRLAPGLSA